MGFQTPRLKLYKPDPSLGQSDPVDVELDLSGNYDIIDDNATVRVRNVGDLPPTSQSYAGGLVFHPSVFRLQNFTNNDYHTYKHLPCWFRAVIQAGSITVNSTTNTTILWGNPDTFKDSFDFGSNGKVTFKKPGTFYMSATVEMQDAAAYEHYMTIRVQDAAGANDLARFADSSVNQCTRSVSGSFTVNASNLNCKADVVVWQDSGIQKIYGQSFAHFSIMRLGGYFDD